MREAEQLSSLTGDIYDAALKPTLWIDVLAKCAQFVGGPAAMLVSRDTPTRPAASRITPVSISTSSNSFSRNTSRSNPLLMGRTFARIGEPVAITDIVRNDELLQERAYREWARPQGLVDVLNAALDKSATSAAVFCVFRHERDGVVDDEMRRRMRLIIPHIRRAVLIGRVIDLQDCRSGDLRRHARRHQRRHVPRRCARAHRPRQCERPRAAGRAQRLALGRRKLAANDADAEQALHEVFLAAGSGDAAVGTKGIAVPLIKRDGERYVAHVLPLTSGARRRAGTSYAAAAALFVHKAALETPSPPEVIAKTFKLTPSELRVLLAIVEVGGVPETADALGIGRGTVKTHLLRVFAKTGTSRQAELVKLVAGFSNPLVG